jgi:hypothetical protein
MCIRMLVREASLRSSWLEWRRWREGGNKQVVRCGPVPKMSSITGPGKVCNSQLVMLLAYALR